MNDYVKKFIKEALTATAYSVIAATATYGVFAAGTAISNKVKSVRKAKKEKRQVEKEAAKNKMRQLDVDDIKKGDEPELSDTANKILKT